MIDHALASLLGDAIHGGPPPEVGRVAAALDARGITLPTAVIATASEEYPGELPGRILAIHPGVYYALGDAQILANSLAATGRLHGKAASVHGPGDLIPGIQQAIVSMREAALANCRDRLGEDPGFAAERDLATVLVQQVRDDDPAWSDSERVWTETVLWRHRHHLNTIRRKLVEIFAACTRACDHSPAVGSALHAAVLRAHRAFAPDDLRSASRAGLDGLRQALATEAPPALARNPALRAALRWIEANYLDPISLADAATAVGVTPTHLAHCCRRELDCSILERIQALRLDHAKELLRHGQDGILAVALASGFPSVEHFHRCFRRATGTTPRRFRLEQADQR